jgi:hypothetical protein
VLAAPAQELMAVVVAVGAPVPHDTIIVTVSWPPINVTWALGAGPRTTTADPKPG